MPDSIPVAVLGATGSVGQRFVQLLDEHPWFKVVALTGSDRSIGQSYSQSCQWILSDPMPEWAQSMIIQKTTTELSGIRLAFSALPSNLASQIEPAFARAGINVCSNASAFRRDPDVPLLLPEVNPDHIELVRIQRKNRGWNGSILTNPNCTSTGLTVVLKALDLAIGVRQAFVVSLQALSGAGYPGVASLDINDNVIPFIEGEEEKVEWEPRKMLGKIVNSYVELADVEISAHTNRVAVSDGHLVCVSVRLAQPANIQEIYKIINDFQAPPISRDLPSTPKPVIQVRDEENRPQPRLDRMTGNGMTTVLGRLRPDPIFDFKFTVLSHNTIRGAAGGSIYNAELLYSQEML